MASIAPTAPELIATIIFTVAVLHTFSVAFIAKFAERCPNHAGFWHFMSEVEVVFGFWAFILIIALFVLSGNQAAVAYMSSRVFTEPLFVFAIMIIAASRPILQAVIKLVRLVARALPIQRAQAVYFLIISLVPLLGSFITEPAAMTLAAMMLRDAYFKNQLSSRLQYATIGVLFVNVSIGGTLTHFAAPPVLMVAAKWQWDTMYMLTHFGWRSALAVFTNAAIVTWLFRKEITAKAMLELNKDDSRGETPLVVTFVHLFFLACVVFYAHYPAVFLGLLLFFVGFTHAYKTHQDRLFIREALMVAFFLAGLVTLGGLQQWWLQVTLANVNTTVLYYIATALTAITDNAALTYLGSLVEGVSDQFKFALVAGAVSGGGLTVIANAPNPAGFSILKGFFDGETISPLYLFLAAFLPTVTAVIAFQFL